MLKASRAYQDNSRVSTTQGAQGKKKTQGTFMNKANNFFIWRNTCIELRK